jgi:hypothetical protein
MSCPNDGSRKRILVFSPAESHCVLELEQVDGSGGLAAVSVGLSPWLLIIVLLIALVVGWKLFQFFFALFR